MLARSIFTRSTSKIPDNTSRLLRTPNYIHHVGISQSGFHSSSISGLRYYARDKGSLYTLETTEVDRVTDLLNFYGLQNWGFVIYRCTYGDDDAWKRFMDHINKGKDHVLRETYDSQELAECVDWSVQQDPTLNGASKDEVRRRFRQWVATDARAEFSSVEQEKLPMMMVENPRYNYCVHVDADSLDSVINRGPPPEQYDRKKESYVNLIRADESWNAPDFDRFNRSTRTLEPDQEEDPYDEGEPEVEGSRLSDVGWMKVCVDGLIPDVYETLTQGEVWDKLYCRPPHKVMKR